jgi:hypothetical protein
VEAGELKIRTRENPVRKDKGFLPRHIPQNTAIYRWSSLRDSKYSLPNGRLRKGVALWSVGDARRSDLLIRTWPSDQTTSTHPGLPRSNQGENNERGLPWLLVDRPGSAEFGTMVGTNTRLLKKREIPSFKVGSDWRINLESIDHWRSKAERREVSEGL